MQRELVRAFAQAPHGEFCALSLPGGEECDCWRAFALSQVPPDELQGEQVELAALSGLVILGRAQLYSLSPERAFLDLIGAEEVTEEAVHVSIQ